MKASLKFTYIKLLVTFLVLLFAASLLFAQVDAGAVLGTITDQSGGVINGAKVVLTNEGTGASLTFTTSSDGVYKFSPVRIGSYKIDVTFQGFQAVTTKGVAVDVGAQVVENFTLKPGNVSQTVEVSATAPLLESQDASVGQVVDSKDMNNLPLNGRNFTFLAQLSAGVNTPQSDTRGNAASGAFSANGQRPSMNNYLLDGIDNNSDTVDFLNGTNYVILPPIDAIQEFKVQSTDFSAEFGRSGAGIVNATIKSGTNELHGAAWEFFRNDKMDAADFFENAGQIPKGELRQNQFGFTAGGPVVIPHVFNGKNKLFFFGDFEGFRRVQGTVFTSSVPTAVERSSGYTNFSDLIAGQPCNPPPSTTPPVCPTDNLGRIIPLGTIMDPATTRAVLAGATDPVSGLVATTTGFVRDPFYTGGSIAGITNFVPLASALNQLPAGRLDANAIKLLNLYPMPTTGSLFSNFASSPKLYEHSNAFDARMDANFTDKNQVFFRFSYKDDPDYIPGPFGGVADGGAFQQGPQTALAQASALGYTHTFSPTLINEVRAGLNYLHTTRTGPESSVMGIPAQYGILDIPQVAENGGLPAFGIGGLSTLGSNNFLPSDEVSSTFQLTDDVTKIYGKHTFKMGFEWQHVKFSTLQPSWSHGQFDFNGQYTDIAGGSNSSNTGRAQLLLAPIASTVAGGVNYVGGTDDLRASNMGATDDGKNYYGGYVNDDWKVTSKLTVNLGLRYDFFGLVFEHHNAQANFVPAAPGGEATEIIPPGNPNTSLLSASYLALLAQDGINLQITNQYGGGLGTSQKFNFAPRVGFAYQASPKLVVRGGFGVFYNGFENRGYSPNLGESYPFQFNFNYPTANDSTPTKITGCSAPAITFEVGFSCTPLSPNAVIANGLGLPGIQFHYPTPYSMGGNLTVQYQVTPTLAVQAGLVISDGRHIEVFPNSNLVSTIDYHSYGIYGTSVGGAPVVPCTGTVTSASTCSLIPYPDFSSGSSYAAAEGNSNYNGLQTKIEKRFANGLNFLFTYTWSKVLTDARDPLNTGSALGSYRGPDVPNFGIHADYQLAPSDIRNVFHFSGGYELPFGKGKKFASGATGLQNQLIGGWSINWSTTQEGGQPISIGCLQSPAAGLGCGALKIPGQSVKVGLHTDSNGKLSLFSNGAAALTQPCVIGANGLPEGPVGNQPGTPVGCVPLTGTAALGGIVQYPGPGYHRLDFSTFKDFPITERVKLQFRAEVFNIFNHPAFNAPNFSGNGVVGVPNSGNYSSTNFGEIGSTRDAPYDPRQIQFALKLYY
ncbi:MAG TPA: TonB-dependent receptor [Candidatus Acidoferrum sp.]|nr:TonB-dependent receptor [Candidatus Acidoferrum sp.]